MNLSSVKVAGIAIVLLVAGIAAGFGLGFGFFQPKISDLENQNSQQQVQISDLQNQISTLLTNITELEERVRDLEFLLGDVHVYPGHSIQEAIDLAQFGDTIFVHSGTYYENVVVNKSISLIGENKDTTIIDGGAKGDVVQVNVNNTVVSGFTIQNSAHELWGNGISIINSSNCSVFDNIIRNNMWGIGLFGGIDCSVYGNKVIHNEHGVVGEVSFWGENRAYLLAVQCTITSSSATGSN